MRATAGLTSKILAKERTVSSNRLRSSAAAQRTLWEPRSARPPYPPEPAASAVPPSHGWPGIPTTLRSSWSAHRLRRGRAPWVSPDQWYRQIAAALPLQARRGGSAGGRGRLRARRSTLCAALRFPIPRLPMHGQQSPPGRRAQRTGSCPKSLRADRHTRRDAEAFLNETLDANRFRSVRQQFDRQQLVRTDGFDFFVSVVGPFCKRAPTGTEVLHSGFSRFGFVLASSIISSALTFLSTSLRRAKPNAGSASAMRFRSSTGGRGS